MIKFSKDLKDARIIGKIAKRAVEQYDADYMTVMMDIEATHCNGNPLRLEELLKADDFNFLHDIGGINRHLDRDTGTLQNCFSPRYSV